MQSPAPGRRAFTLIELLVVISIIVILMSLGFPLYGVIFDNTRKTQAKNDASQIARSLEAYLAEYGKLPAQGAGNVNSKDLMNTLSAAIQDDPNNPRNVAFLSVPRAKAHKNGAEPNPDGTYSSAYKDPWGNDYEIRIDNEGGGDSYSGTVQGPNGVIHASAIVWSKGNPANAAAFANPAKWAKSWE